jgi:outer membrane protein TolC
MGVPMSEHGLTGRRGGVEGLRRQAATGAQRVAAPAGTRPAAHSIRPRTTTWGLWTTALAAVLLGCQSDAPNVEGPISAYRDRMLVQHQDEPQPPPTGDLPKLHRDPVARPASGQANLPQRTALLTQPATASQPSPEEVLAEMPDPRDADTAFGRRLEALRHEQAAQQDQRVVRNYERVAAQAAEYLKKVALPQQQMLSLSECIQRALSNNYSIRVEAYNPAISQTQIVEAEAAFDVEFFLNTSWANLDQAVEPHTLPGTSDTRALQAGFRELLPSGMQASIALAQQRLWSGTAQASAQGQPLKIWNPTWPTNLVGTLRQPLLRGFGLDVNRAQIDLGRVNYQISQETFVQRVRDTLLDVESAYWRLAQSRRTASILAESVAQNFITFQNMKERLGHDATEVEVANSESNFQTAYVNYLEAVKLVRDAEDRLKDLINDPDFKLSDNIEIIPTEVPDVAAMVLDHFGEVRTALDRRAEIRAAQQRINGARIGTAAAKNAILPQLDLTFTYEVQGTGNTAEHGFNDMTSNRFISYTLAASFSYSFGERKARAAYRRARLQESQAVVGLNQLADAVVEEVNGAIRTLMVRYEQLPPSLSSVVSAERNLRALQARTQRIDPTYLQTELSAVGQLAQARSTLLQVVTDYNVGIIQLEKAKGTLLDYNNIVVTDGPRGH